MTAILVLGILVAIVGGIVFLINRSSRNANMGIGYGLIAVGGLAILVSIVAALIHHRPGGERRRRRPVRRSDRGCAAARAADQSSVHRLDSKDEY